MAQIALNPETDPRASVAAGNAVLDRAYGKPSQHIQMERLQSLSDEQLNAELLACIRERDSIRKA